MAVAVLRAKQVPSPENFSLGNRVDVN